MKSPLSISSRFLAILSASALLAAGPAAPLQAEEGFVPLFNGKDLDGWKVPENNIWWLVEDGVLQSRSCPDQIGTDLWTEEDFGDFILEFEFLFGEGDIDSGIFVRNDDQIQIGVSGSLQRDMTGSPYIPSKRGYPVEAEGVADLLKLDDWNHLRIEARGMEYTISLNGKKVLVYESDTGIPEGPIGIQLHAKRDMEIDFRDIRVKRLD